MTLNQEEYKLLYYEILNGSSYYYDEKFNFYVKHLSAKDLNLINKKRIEIRNKTYKIGLLKEEDQLNNLIQNGSWSQEQENEIFKLKSFIKNLKYTKSKLITSRDIQNINNEIKESEKNLDLILKEKNDLVGTTAESYIEKKINEYYIYISLYKDEELKSRFFTESEFDYLDYDQLYELYLKYNLCISKFSEKNIKKISVSNFFLNSFYICEDNPFVFFGKSIHELTFSQIELFTYAKYFKNIINNGKTRPPESILSDPDALIEWSEGAKNVDSLLSKTRNKEIAGSSIIGASKEDLKKIGLENKDGIDLMKEAAKKGGALSFQDLIKLHNA